jgi:hypothetical protein
MTLQVLQSGAVVPADLQGDALPGGEQPGPQGPRG